MADEGTRIAILAVDDDAEDGLFLKTALEQQGFPTDIAADLRSARGLLGRRAYGVLIADLVLPDGSGLELLAEARGRDPHVVPIVRTGFASTANTVAALRQGAYDYLVKPCPSDILLSTVARAAEKYRLRRELAERNRELESANRLLESRVHGATREIFELNERLKRTVEDLVESNNAQTRFLEDMIHEMKNPLSVVSGYAAFLTSRPLSEWRPEDITRILGYIHSYAKHLESLIQELADSLRIANRTITLRRRVFPVLEALRDAVEGLKLQAQEKGVSLELELPQDPALSVFADPTRVRQILVNLIANAIRHTPAGGRVTARALAAEGERAHLCVEDTGCGIEAKHLPRIFQRFYQVPESGEQKGRLGLGLSIVSGLVTLHGGRLWVESEPGKGSRFHFTLPGKRAAAEGAPAQAAAAPQ